LLARQTSEFALRIVLSVFGARMVKGRQTKQASPSTFRVALLHELAALRTFGGACIELAGASH
jgi:hypothetical protein